MPILFIRWRFGIDMNPGRLIVGIPDRYSMPPPELPADTPVLNIIDPMLKGLDPALRPKPDLPSRNRLQSFCHPWISEEPLLAEPRLNRHTSSLAVTDAVLVFLFTDQHS